MIDSCEINMPASKNAYWIFSGNEYDYDNYYMTCSVCESQRMVYDRNNKLDIPVACPRCGVKINLNALECGSTIKRLINKTKLDPLYDVHVVRDNGIVRNEYTMRVHAKNEDDAIDKVMAGVNGYSRTKSDTELYIADVQKRIEKGVL